MKKTVCVLFVLICIFLSACTSSSKLIVNGNEIDSRYVTFNSDKTYAELPFIAIIEALGGETNWVDDENAVISLYDNRYTLNLENCYLAADDDPINLIIVSFGSNHGTYYKRLNKEIIIDSDSLMVIFQLNGIKIRIDYDNSIVNIFKDE